MDFKRYIETVGFKGLCYTIIGKLRGRPILFQTRRENCAHPFWLRIPSSDAQAYQQVFIQNEYDFTAHEAPHVIVDGGANIGFTSIYFANRFPDAHILAIEPEDANYQILAKNVASYPNIIPIQAAIWHKNEMVDLIDPGFGNWSMRIDIGEAQTLREPIFKNSVQGVTIDKLIQDYNLEQIDILKLDIEGAEKNVFAHNQAWIENIHLIIIELHERMVSGSNDSFGLGSSGFVHKWQLGENIYASRSKNKFQNKQ